MKPRSKTIGRHKDWEDSQSGYNLPNRKPKKLTIATAQKLGRLKIVKAKHERR